MDYEKSYKEALERARAGKPMNEVFPELHESEDERIRKEIINYLLYKAKGVSEEQEHSWVAYLEKQQEPNPSTPEDISAAYQLGLANGRKEQKPIQTENEREYVRTLKSLISDFIRGKDGVDKAYYQKIYDWLDGMHIEQPADWSEEDEKMRQDTIRFIETGWTDNGKSHLIPWLKALPERFALQPKQEWSEEDEAAFGDLMWCIEQARKSAKDENDMGNIWFAENWVKNRLKYLRPQPITYALDAPLGYDKDMNPIYPPINHWKPSEEQMKALENVIKCELSAGLHTRAKILQTLQNDLKSYKS